MKSRAGRLLFLSWCLFAAPAGPALAQNESVDGPAYDGKALAVWADEARALGQPDNIYNTNYPAVRAIRAIGTNAIPWLLSEMKKHPASEERGSRTNKQQPLTNSGSNEAADSHYHQLRARAGFWALGDTAAPAIPTLVSLLEEQPYAAPYALASIGAPALPALAHCLTNVPPDMSSNGLHARIAASAIGGLFVAIKVGRISKPEAAFLLPAVRDWAQSTNRDAVYWARGVLEQLELKH